MHEMCRKRKPRRVKKSSITSEDNLQYLNHPPPSFPPTLRKRKQSSNCPYYWLTVQGCPTKPDDAHYFDTGLRAVKIYKCVNIHLICASI